MIYKQCKQHEMCYRAKIWTFAICLSTFTMGISNGFLGPGVLELSKAFNTDIATISKAFTVIIITYTLGTIAGGITFNYINRELGTSIFLVIIGIGTILIPIAPSLLLFFCTVGLVSFGSAGCNTSQTVWILEMFQTKATPFISSLHTAYALGSFLSPLIMRPFLPDENVYIQKNNSQSNFIFGEIGTKNGTLGNETLRVSTIDIHRQVYILYIPFLIGGVLVILSAFLILLLYWIQKYEKPISTLNETKIKKSSRTRTVLLVFLTIISLGTYQGMQAITIQFMPSFSYFTETKLTQAEGALLVSGLIGTFTIGRVIGIFLVLKIYPEIILLCNIILTILGNTLLIFTNSSSNMLWGACIILGFGFSTVQPLFYGYLGKHLKFSNLIGAIVIGSTGSLAAVYPICLGNQIETNPIILTHINYISIATCTITFIMIYFITNRTSSSSSLVINETEIKKIERLKVSVMVPLKPES